AKLVAALDRKAWDRGAIVYARGSVLRLAPPLCITRDEGGQLIGIVADSIGDLERDLARRLPSMASPHDLAIPGGPRYRRRGAAAAGADVAVRGDRIVGVGTIAERGGVELDAAGLAVSPGFIDVHSHDDFAVLTDPRMAFKVMQGVTTDVVGNCGSGVIPFDA